MKSGIVLISCGIDSPVAAHIMKKRGLEVVGMHCDNQPYSDEKSVEKTKRLCRIVGISKLYIIPHGLINHSKVLDKVPAAFTCIICKRMMMRIANEIAIREGYDVVITGDNLGQVASQTIENMKVISSVSTKEILRPLLCNDKNDTIKIAREIGTFDISIESSVCCTAVPKSPKTKSTIEQLEREEAKLPIDEMVSECVLKAKIVDI